MYQASTIVTSEINLQVHTIANPGGGFLPLADYAVILTSANGRESSAKTDSRGLYATSRTAIREL